MDVNLLKLLETNKQKLKKKSQAFFSFKLKTQFLSNECQVSNNVSDYELSCLKGWKKTIFYWGKKKSREKKSK